MDAFFSPVVIFQRSPSFVWQLYQKKIRSQDALPDLSDAGSEEIQEAIRCGLVGSGTQQLFGGKFFLTTKLGYGRVEDFDFFNFGW